MPIYITPGSYQHNELLAFITTKYITKLERMQLLEIKEDSMVLLCWEQKFSSVKHLCFFKSQNPEPAQPKTGKRGCATSYHYN